MKSVAGLRPDEAELRPDGLLGDRGHVLVTADGTVLTAKTAPLLRTLDLGGSAADPLLAVPGGRPGDLEAVAALLGSGPVRLRADPAGARQVAPVHVVTRAQREDPAAGDASRANLVVDLGGPGEPAAGAELVLGDPDAAPVRLRLGARPRHCAGWFAEVVVGGTLRRGAPVQVLPAHG
ncbi:hypothetical protein GTR02_09850 [Kineococcus sp. R8]|uniref:MOSC N-terminal beta barrel domain-containing protein n=1 Tax=Kineococcus siccus TaxID=2696567 RepID=UPI001412E983|nr:hypothetical protein [Kineococcus siccus]